MKLAILAITAIISISAQAQTVHELPIDYQGYEDCSKIRSELWLKSSGQRDLNGRVYHKYNGKWVSSPSCIPKIEVPLSLFGYEEHYRELARKSHNNFWVYTEQEFQQALAQRQAQDQARQQSQQQRVNKLISSF